MDYRYSNHVPHVQTSASIKGESCQAELCHVSCMNLLQHNEKAAVALHLIQFHPLTLPLSNFLSVKMIIISNTSPVSLKDRVLHLNKKKKRWCHLNKHRPQFFIRNCVTAYTWPQLQKRLRQTPQLFLGCF